MSHLKLESVKNYLRPILDTSPGELSQKVNIPAIVGRVLLKVLILSTAVLITWGVFTHLPVTSQDWQNSFRPAALQWHDPYHTKGLICNPPWIFLLLYPLAVLPHPAGVGILILASIVAVGTYVGSLKKAFFVAASAPMAILIVLGQLDALLLLGLMIPYGLGLPILLVKPQGLFLTIFQRLNRWSVLVVMLTFVASVLIWGNWWSNVIACRPNQSGNMSLFPYTVVLGIPLAYWGLKRKSDALLCGASLCFSPFFMPHSMLPAVAAIVRETDDWRWWSVVVVGSWIYVAAMKGFLW